MSQITGSTMQFNPTMSGMVAGEVTVIRALTDDEIDREDVGDMYEVRYGGGTTAHAFVDELSVTA